MFKILPRKLNEKLIIYKFLKFCKKSQKPYLKLHLNLSIYFIHRLNAGWSYRTEKNTLFTSKNSQLSENEILAIQKVLERSQMLEKIEQERVRLEKNYEIKFK